MASDNAATDPTPVPSRRTFRITDLLLITTVIGGCLGIYAQWGVQGILPAGCFLAISIAGLSRYRDWLLWKEILVVWMIVAILCWWILPAVPGYFGHINSSRNLRTIWQVMEIRSHGTPSQPLTTSYTSPGSPVAYSWRVTLWEGLNGPGNLNRSLPWNHPANAQFAADHAHEFRCPWQSGMESSETTYVAITGPDTCWPDEGLNRKDIPDGESNTILVVDSHRTGIVWTEPRDFKASELNWQINGGPNSIQAEHGAHIQYLDGSRRPTGPRSTRVLMADGSVRSLSEGTDPIVLQQLANRHDGEPKKSPLD